MQNNKKEIVLSALVVALVLFIAISFWQQSKIEKQVLVLNNFEDKPFVYGELFDFFVGQVRITYPLIFHDIRDISSPSVQSINFGPQKLGEFEVYMKATKTSKAEAKKSNEQLIERGWFSEPISVRGYPAELLSVDLKARPEEGVSDCGISYLVTIPLMTNDNNLSLLIGISQPQWAAEENFHCALYDDKNYNYFKGMVDHVIENIQPAF